MKFNNTYAVLITALIFTFFFLSMTLGWNDDMVKGALVSGLTMVIMFYFRRAPKVKGK